MKVRYLGTAAYEGVPSLFCQCRVCKESMKKGGRNLRSRSQMLVNDDLLIDFPPDTVWHAHKYGIDWGKIGNCLITHSHSDHLYPEDMLMAHPGYSHDIRPIKYFSGESGATAMRKCIGGICPERADIEVVSAGQKFTAGGYKVLALSANHSKDTSPLIYAIEKDGKRMLYAHDTGIFPEDVWEPLRAFGRLDFISFDCTGCLAGMDDEFYEWKDGHMSLRSNLRMLDRMKALGIADDKTVVAVSHFSHNGAKTYDEMAEGAKNYGVIVAYDGLEIEF